MCHLNGSLGRLPWLCVTSQLVFRVVQACSSHTVHTGGVKVSVCSVRGHTAVSKGAAAVSVCLSVWPSVHMETVTRGWRGTSRKSGLVWVRTLACHIKRSIRAEGVWERGPAGNIWNQVAGRPIPVWGVFTCWDYGFEFRRGHGYLSLVSVVCCHVVLYDVPIPRPE